jgi:SPP1 gp7 family putative phage head morphogenesis protein
MIMTASSSESSNRLFFFSDRTDPTRTTTLRKQYEAALVKRFKQFRADIIEAFGDAEFDSSIATNAKRPKFKFASNPEKVGEFMDWLRKQSSRRILEVEEGTPLGKAASSAWQNKYIRSAYQKGIASAVGQMKKGGVKVKEKWVDAAFLRPVHADRVGIIYTRAYSDLKGINDEMDKQISGALARGMAEGQASSVIAASIVERVDKIGIARARVLARTETISAHANAALNTYEEAGIEGVNVKSEFTTAGDNKVCKKCAALEGRVYSVKSARGVIPVHPNCRCAWLPVVNSPGMEIG